MSDSVSCTMAGCHGLCGICAPKPLGLRESVDHIRAAWQGDVDAETISDAWQLAQETLQADGNDGFVLPENERILATTLVAICEIAMKDAPMSFHRRVILECRARAEAHLDRAESILRGERPMTATPSAPKTAYMDPAPSTFLTAEGNLINAGRLLAELRDRVERVATALDGKSAGCATDSQPIEPPAALVDRIKYRGEGMLAMLSEALAAVSRIEHAVLENPHA